MCAPTAVRQPGGAGAGQPATTAQLAHMLPCASHSNRSAHLGSRCSGICLCSTISSLAMLACCLCFHGAAAFNGFPFAFLLSHQQRRHARMLPVRAWCLLPLFALSVPTRQSRHAGMLPVQAWQHCQQAPSVVHSCNSALLARTALVRQAYKGGRSSKAAAGRCAIGGGSGGGRQLPCSACKRSKLRYQHF